MKYILLFFISLLSLSASAQYHTLSNEQQAEIKKQETRKKLALDDSVPDFETKKIDAKVMGTRLAKLLSFLLENYQQGFYISQLKDIALEQDKSLENVYLQIKKLSFEYAIKRGDELAVMMKLQLHKNSSGVKQTNLLFYFINGVSEDHKTNELFLQMSRYVPLGEK